MQQLELFSVSPFMQALTLSSRQMYMLRERDVNLYWFIRDLRKRVRDEVARATFIAKVKGYEFSRVKF